MKKRIMKVWVRRIMIFGMAFLVCKSPVFTTLASSVQDAKEEKSRLEKRKEEAQKVLRQLEAEKSDIVKYIESLDKKQRELEGEIAKLDEEITDANEELKQTQTELKEAKETVSEQYSIMKKRIKYMYENGSSGYLDIFLEAESMADLLNQAEYMSKIAEYDNKLLERYEASQKVVQDKEKAIEAQLANLAILAEELQVEKETNEKLAADKAEQVRQYNGLIDDAGTEVDNYGIEIAEQDELIDELIAEQERKRKEEEERKRQEEERRRKEEEERRRQEEEKKQQNQQNQSNGDTGTGESNGGGNTNSNSNGQELLNGGLIWPMPASRRITSGFGSRSEVMNGSGTFHSGVDIGVAAGTNIIAAASGTVVEAAYNWSMGNYVLIDHGNNVYTIYMHSSKLLVSAGDYVAQGGVIALVGSTGLSTGPHLHFGLKVNGSYVNPLNYVSY